MPDNLVPLDFPRGGISKLHGFGAQPPGTTPQALNVRTFEPSTQRGRGGSRPGISKYISGQIPTAGKIQCLDYVVDPAAEAILASFGNGDPGDPGVTDPSTNPPGSVIGDGKFRNPGNTWRTGGSGMQPNRNVQVVINNPVHGTVVASPDHVAANGTDISTISVTVLDRYNFPAAGDAVLITTSPTGRVGHGTTGTVSGLGLFEVIVTNTNQETVTYTAKDTTKNVTIGSDTVTWGGWQYIQGDAFIKQSGVSFLSTSLSFPSNVTAGNLLVALIWTQSGSAITSSVTDTQGNTWTKAIGPTQRRQLWYTVAGSSGANTITYSGTATFMTMTAIAEYSGNSASPLDSTASAGDHIGSTTWDTGTVTITSSNGLIVGGYVGFSNGTGFGSFSATGSYNYRVSDVSNDSPPSTMNNFCIVLGDQLNVTSNSNVQITSSTTEGYDVFGVSFK